MAVELLIHGTGPHAWTADGRVYHMQSKLTGAVERSGTKGSATANGTKPHETNYIALVRRLMLRNLVPSTFPSPEARPGLSEDPEP